VAFAVLSAARLPLLPPSRAGPLTTLQTSRNAADRSVASPKGLSTLGFDPTRFQTEPPVCYRASWQLPGPDSHRQATTSTNHKTTPLHHEVTSQFRWAHERSRLGRVPRIVSGGVSEPDPDAGDVDGASVDEFAFVVAGSDGAVAA